MIRFTSIALLLAATLSAHNAFGYPLVPAFTNAEYRVTKFGVDAQGRVKTVTNALNQVATFRYDAVGNMSNRTDAAGVATRYLYDGINRLTNIVYASTGQRTILRYDANSNLTNAWATNSTAFAKVVNLALRYDNRDRLTNATTTAGSATWSVGYRHDLNGNTTNIIYPGGLVCTYTFDTQDRCTSVTDWLGRQTQFGYDDANRLTSITYPAANGVTATFGYDAMGRRTSYSYTKGSTLAARTLVRNALGFKYQENVTAGYAPAPTNQILRSSTFNDVDRLVSSTNAPGGSIAYGHDSKGNLTNLVSATSTNVWVWDDDNRLKSATNNAVATSCLYDAVNTRVGTLTGTTTNLFAVNQSAGLKNVLVEMNGAGTAQRYYIWGPAGLICHIEAGSNVTRYYHPDELGSTLLMSDESGAVTDQFAYQPYGELINRTGSTITPYKWLGGLALRDEGNSQYYMLNRYYSTDQKRFLTEDPAGIDSWPNLYAYANLNPVFFVDPFGLEARPPTAGAAYSLGSLWDDLKFSFGGSASPSATYVQYVQTQAVAQKQANAQWQSMGPGYQLASQVPMLGAILAGDKLGVGLDVLSGGRGRLPGARGLGRYEVGSYNLLREGAEAGLDAHHVGQKALMRQFVESYDPRTAPSILVPKAGHTVGESVLSRNMSGFSNARDVIARDIRELRRVYPDIPNSQLQRLIEMNKQMYPEVGR